jgi:hypothetical protein
VVYGFGLSDGWLYAHLQRRQQTVPNTTGKGSSSWCYRVYSGLLEPLLAASCGSVIVPPPGSPSSLQPCTYKEVC